ncbi:3-keto-disaccharide hydrolase [Luteolibacter marinus]|uniref:3-keto-disaccharide hydrolase n=1 Tax=Luteolibacter marinus TaxID=2776705 RepID=UPI00186648D3|nr:DUF1080 domain-containing protein [Luteolibacter marinus]
MKTLLISLLALGALHAAPEPIFTGKDLSGWKIEGGNYWTAKDGVLTGESDEKKQNSILWTEKEYTDFTIEAGFRFEGHVDSGFFLRGPNDQIQIGISGSLKRDMTGSPYIASKGKYPKEAEGVAELLKEGEWNTMKITAKGKVYTVELNGKKVLEYESDTAGEKGPVGLQVHPGLQMKIEFRDLKLEELKG